MDISQSIPEEVEDIEECKFQRARRPTCSENVYYSSFKRWTQRTTPSVLHRLTITAWESYSFLFFRSVVGLTASGFSWLYLVSQLTKVITITLVKCYCQRSHLPAIGRTLFYGNDKQTIHLLGSIGILFFWPFILAPCISCSAKVSLVLMVVAYSFPAIMFSCFWTLLGMREHILNEGYSVRLSQSDYFENVLHSSTQKSTLGLLLHLTTWFFLANSEGEHISADTQNAFANQTLFIVIFGFCSTFLYHLSMYKTTKRQHMHRTRGQQNDSTNQVDHSTVDDQDDLRILFLWPWQLRFQDLNYLRSVFVYALSANAFSILLLFLPLYLMESIQSNKLSVAYFPAVVFGGWSLAGLAIRKLVTAYGYKMLLCASSVMMLAASIWFFSQSATLSILLYLPAMAFGFSGCVMMVTSHMMVFMTSKYIGIHLIGDRHDFTNTLDEMCNGLVVFVILQFFPDGDEKSSQTKSSAEFLRIALFLVPALFAVVILIEVFFYVDLQSGKPLHVQTLLSQRVRLTKFDPTANLVIDRTDLEALEQLPSTEI